MAEPKVLIPSYIDFKWYSEIWKIFFKTLSHASVVFPMLDVFRYISPREDKKDGFLTGKKGMYGIIGQERNKNFLNSSHKHSRVGPAISHTIFKSFTFNQQKKKFLSRKNRMVIGPLQRIKYSILSIGS